MEAGSIIVGAKGAWEIGKGAYNGWKWYERWQMGKVTIHTPRNNVSVAPGGVEFGGTHEKARGNYWLMTVRNDQYWPKDKINLSRPDGTWDLWVGIGDHPGPRESIVGLFWVSDFMESWLNDYKKHTGDYNNLVDKFNKLIEQSNDLKERPKEKKKWDAVTMRPPRKHMRLVQGVVLNVR